MHVIRRPLLRVSSPPRDPVETSDRCNIGVRNCERSPTTPDKRRQPTSLHFKTIRALVTARARASLRGMKIRAFHGTHISVPVVRDINQTGQSRIVWRVVFRDTRKLRSCMQRARARARVRPRLRGDPRISISGLSYRTVLAKLVLIARVTRVTQCVAT